jgi:hypothetical protein
MTFRSDDDAREERVRALEKQLEDARRELSTLRPKADRLDIAEKENKRLLAELTRSRPQAVTASQPSNVRLPLLLLVALVGLLFAGLAAAGLLLSAPSMSDQEAGWQAQEEAFQQQARAEEARARSEAELAETQRQLAEEQAALAATDPVVAAVPAAPVDPPMVIDDSIDFPAISATGRATTVTGDAPVTRRATCQVSITPGQGDCRAEVFCGGQSIYPRNARGGYFQCQVADHVLVSGADVNTTGVDRDPRFELDLPHHRVTVSDGPSPEWSVTVTYDAD